MKKNYLQITPFFPTDSDFRGAYIYDQVNSIRKISEFELVVVKTISFFSSESDEPYDYQGIKVYPFRVYDLPSFTFPGLFHKINLFRFKHFINKELKLKISDIDIAHGHVSYPAGHILIDIFQKYPTKTIIQHHGLDVFQFTNGQFIPEFLRKFHESYLSRIQTRVVKNVDINLGVSWKVIDSIKSLAYPIRGKFEVLYNGVDTDKFNKINKKFNSDLLNIGCIGNFWEIKDQITVLKALVKCGRSDICVTFIGSGETKSMCESYVASHNLENQVSFVNEVDHRQLNNFYNNLDLFVLPSYYEAFGCVYIEALSCGVPIVGVYGQGIEEIVFRDSLSNSLIRKSDYNDLAKIMISRLNYRGTDKPQYNDYSIDSFVGDFLSNL